MKEKLLKLLNEHAATAGLDAWILDSLSEDLLAVIVRAVVPCPTNDELAEFEHRVNGVFNDHFGVKLSNLFTVEPFHGKKELPYYARKRVVLAMIRAMLFEQDDLFARNAELQGDCLKRRLSELKYNHFGAKSETIN
jgi:hypothetical protein